MRLLSLILILYSVNASAQQVRVVKFDSVNELIHKPASKIQVLNFWATWCAPCVKELPFFEAQNASNNTETTITLISLDFADKVDKVNLFLSKKKMKLPVLLLDEIDYNSWIDKVDKNWSGAIPATLIINTSTGKRKFVEKELQEGDLEKLIEEVK